MIEWFVTSFLFAWWILARKFRVFRTSFPVVVEGGGVAHAGFGAFVASISVNGLVAEALMGLSMYYAYVVARFVMHGDEVDKVLTAFIGGYASALASRVFTSL